MALNENNLVKFCPAPRETCLWELKKSRTKTPDKFYYDQLEKHQEKCLLQSKTKTGVWWKCPDMGLGAHQLMCDGFYIKEAKVAYVIIIFYTPRAKKTFYYIDIDDLLFERARHPRKALTKTRASEICRYEITV